MCCCRHTIHIKCASPYPMMNSLLSTCSQLYQPRLCMHLFSQATLMSKVRINITIIRLRINQNRSKSTTELMFHLNNGFLVIYVLVIKSSIKLRNAMTNIPNYLCLLNIVELGPTTLVQWKILLVMIFATYQTLQ